RTVGDGADEAVLLRHVPLLLAEEIDRVEPDALGLDAERVERHAAEAPSGDALLVARGGAGAGRLGGAGGARKCRGGRRRESGAYDISSGGAHNSPLVMRSTAPATARAVSAM